MDKDYYCPECGEKLFKSGCCGSTGYFCMKCHRLISRSKMLEQPPTKDSKTQ